mmetsp:Transcript_18270/g.38158  ORF Transcript_18270/g.38158 Transcript_18270/m.38158 type:complete len:212 (-) Transcript_18270:161-796(-)
MAFVSCVGSTFSGARLSAKVARPSAKISMMAKSKALPFLEAPKNLDGSDPAGDSQFDPFGFTTFFPKAWMQEAEVKHGRIAMLAALGFLVEEFVRLPFYSAPHLIVDTHDYFVKGGPLLQILIFTSAWELICGTPAIFETLQGSSRKPGEFWFDPLKLGGEDEATKHKMRTHEIIHGRTAMIAVSGMIHHQFLTKMNLVEQLSTGKIMPGA